MMELEPGPQEAAKTFWILYNFIYNYAHRGVELISWVLFSDKK